MAKSPGGKADAIRQAAEKLFFSKGYDATSLRQLAAAAGLMVGSLYNHMESKEDLLLQIMGGVMDDLLEAARNAALDAPDPLSKLQAVLSAHLRFHAESAAAVFIGNAELRCLSEAARRRVIDKRHEYELLLQGLIEDAARAGLADVVDARTHVYSFIAQATHVASWYEPGGRKSLEDIVRDYTRLALRELRVADADSRVGP